MENGNQSIMSSIIDSNQTNTTDRCVLTFGLEECIARFEIKMRIIWWVYGVLIPVVCVPGALVTVASIIVFAKKLRGARFERRARSSNHSLHTLLLGLSIFDFIVMVSALLFFPGCAPCYVENKCSYCNTVALSFALPIISTAQFCSVWTCVVMTVDRFIAVKYPMKSLTLLTTRRAWQSLIIVALIAVLYRLPCWFEWENGQPTELRMSYFYVRWYRLYITIVVLFVIPWSLMITLNALVYRTIRSATLNRRQLANGSGNQSTKGKDADTNLTSVSRKSFWLALIVVVSFMVFYTPSFLMSSIESFNITDLDLSRSFYVAYELLTYSCNLLVCVNSATNFLIYCAMGPWFRKQFADTFLICRAKQQEMFSHVTATHTHTNHNHQHIASQIHGKSNNQHLYVNHNNNVNNQGQRGSTIMTNIDEAASVLDQEQTELLQRQLVTAAPVNDWKVNIQLQRRAPLVESEDWSEDFL